MTKKTLMVLVCSQLFFSLGLLACSCGKFDPVQSIQDSSNILLVRVNHVEILRPSNSEDFEGGERAGHFEVIKAYKGSADSITHMVSADEPVCCICQSRLLKGSEYIIFNNGPGAEYLGACGATQRVVSGQNDYLKQLIPIVNSGVRPDEFNGYIKNWPGEFYEISKARTFRLEGGGRWGLKRGKYLVKFKGYQLSNDRIYALELLESNDASKNSNELIYESRLK